MRAVVSTVPGGPETLEIRDMPTPEPGEGEVRIAVRAAGVNFPDTLIIQDLYQFRPERPFSPGSEVSGVIDAVGPGVDGLRVGQRVLAMTLYGGFAEQICVPAQAAIPIPDAMPFDEAACFIFTYGTSYYALHDCGRIASGDTVLVLGAAGGIGTSAVELALAEGARVIAAVSSPDKAAFCKDLGAQETVIYPRDMDRDAQKAFSTAIKQAAGSGGCDIVYDAVGGDYAEPALRAIAWDGRYLVVGFPAGIPKIPLNLPLLKNCSINGVFWGTFTRNFPDRFRGHVEALFSLYEAGRIKPRISASFPMEQAADALNAILDRSVRGKMVIRIAQG